MGNVRSLLGVILVDLPRYWWRLAATPSMYLAICNRNEQLEAAPDATGYRCRWRWTSDLHAPKHLTFLGRWLLRRALTHHPISSAAMPADPSIHPQISFIIGHRGVTRLPHLLATLESIASQRDAAVECIVVEQDVDSQLAPHLPSWVRLVHTPPPTPDMPYCRSWTFNVGAKFATGEVLVLHDNDMLVPTDYAAWILQRVAIGYQVINPKRFIFYLARADTEQVFAVRQSLLDFSPEVVVQNLEGGGSVAITRSAFGEIGGMDEAFVGWGGEDNEFWDRAQVLRIWPWAGLPLVHLWHAAQPGKHDASYHTVKLFEQIMRTGARERIAQLRAREQGRLSGPSSNGAAR